MHHSKRLARAFRGTLAAPLLACLVAVQLAACGTSPGTAPVPTSVATATPVPTESPGGSTPAQPSPGVSPSSVPSDQPAPSPKPTATIAPSPTPKPTPTPPSKPTPTPPAVTPGTTVEIVLKGSAYSRKTVPSNGTVTAIAGGGVLLQTTSEGPSPLLVIYELPISRISPGMKVVRLDAAVCGSASGEFWETYGPIWALPSEYEALPPGPDGCWHYIGIGHALGSAISETAVTVSTSRNSRFQVSRVVYILHAK